MAASRRPASSLAEDVFTEQVDVHGEPLPRKFFRCRVKSGIGPIDDERADDLAQPPPGSGHDQAWRRAQRAAPRPASRRRSTTPRKGGAGPLATARSCSAATACSPDAAPDRRKPS